MQHLLLEVLDYDRGKKDDFIGLTSLPIDALIKVYESRTDKGLPFAARSLWREREPQSDKQGPSLDCQGPYLRALPPLPGRLSIQPNETKTEGHDKKRLVEQGGIPGRQGE
jgi:hypothetical protein